MKKWCNKPIKIVRKEDILLSVRASVGEINLADKEYCIGRGLCAIRTKNQDKVMQDYIFYIIKYMKKHFKDIGTGSTFVAINKNDIENTKIPLPSIKIQNEIVTRLNRQLNII